MEYSVEIVQYIMDYLKKNGNYEVWGSNISIKNNIQQVDDIIRNIYYKYDTTISLSVEDYKELRKLYNSVLNVEGGMADVAEKIVKLLGYSSTILDQITMSDKDRIRYLKKKLSEAYKEIELLKTNNKSTETKSSKITYNDILDYSANIRYLGTIVEYDTFRECYDNLLIKQLLEQNFDDRKITGIVVKAKTTGKDYATIVLGKDMTVNIKLK